jgi:serine/threonine protein phosphatase PrpC
MNQTIFKTAFKIQSGHLSIKGSGRENQDDFFNIYNAETDSHIFGIADGHGPTGKIASSSSKKTIEEFVLANIEELSANPVSFLEKCFEQVQENVRRAIVEDAEKKDPKPEEVVVNSDGAVLMRRYEFQALSNINGGTMLSVAILMRGVLYVANVGDCDGILCAKTPILKQTSLKYEKDAGQIKHVGYTDETLTTAIVLTRDHSPDNVDEYKRIRESVKDPKLLFVYDEQGREKAMCEPIFEDGADGPVVRTDVPFYHKNVSKQRATYIATPSDAQYRDALASTRSIGDFNLNKYGLSAKPEIQSIDLNTIFESMVQEAIVQEASVQEAQSTTEPKTLCLVFGSDGVWDNWIVDHVQKFVMDPSCLNAIRTPDGAERVTKSFMARNLAFSKKHFGNYNYDDATSVIMYISIGEPIVPL